MSLTVHLNETKNSLLKFEHRKIETLMKQDVLVIIEMINRKMGTFLSMCEKLFKWETQGCKIWNTHTQEEPSKWKHKATDQSS